MMLFCYYGYVNISSHIIQPYYLKNTFHLRVINYESTYQNDELIYW